MRIHLLLILAAVPGLLGQKGPAAAAGVTEVSGRVVDSSSGSPVVNARVALIRVTPRAIQVPSGWATRAVGDEAPPEGSLFLANTGPDGAFRFRVSAPAFYLPLAAAAGFADSGDYRDRAKVIELKAGAMAAPLVIALEREAMISGRVLDHESGAPLSGFTVSAKAWASRSSWGGRALAKVQTDAAGFYRLTGLRAGRYALVAESAEGPAFEPAVDETRFREDGRRGYGRAFYPGVADSGQAAGLDVWAGSALEKVDFGLRKTKLGAVRGRVSGAGLATAPPLVLQLFENQSTRTSLQFERVVSTTVQGDSGFRLENLPAGRYLICAVSDQRAEGAPRLGCAAVDGSQRQEAELRIESGLEVPVVLRFREDAQPAKAQGHLLVMLRPLDRPSFWWESAMAVSLAGGAPTIWPCVLPGHYDVEVGGLPAGFGLAGLLWNGAAVSGRRIAVEGGAPRQELGLVVTGALGELQVRWKVGAKGAGWRIVVAPEGTPVERVAWEGRLAVADEAGRATFTGLAPGRYRVAGVAGPGRVWAEEVVEAWVEVGAAVEVQAGGRAEVEVSGQ